VRYFLLLALLQAMLFALVYGGADYITSRREFRVRVHFEFERNIPFVPAMTWLYVSVYPLAMAAPVILRSRRELFALFASHAAATVVAGVCFLLFPAELAYPKPTELGMHSSIFHFADGLNLEYNLAPSLHVAYSGILVMAYAGKARSVCKAVLWIWAGGIAVSTLLTHQHHVVDVVTGFLLAAAVMWLVYGPCAGGGGEYGDGHGAVAEG